MITSEEFDCIYHDAIKNKIAIPDPKLIITYGPPSSGKGYIIDDFVIKELNIPQTSIIRANVDEIVAKIKGYQNEIEQCKVYFSNILLNKDVDKTWSSKCNSIYKKYRCESADIIVEKLLKYGIEKKLNIIFETTGGNVTWVIDNLISDAKKNGFTIYVVYPIANINIMAHRLLSRARVEGRYPELDVVKLIVDKAQTNIITLLPHVNYIYIYDNNCLPVKMVIIQKLNDDKYHAQCKINKLDNFLDDRSDTFKNEIIKLCSTGDNLVDD
ncbi:MAG: hypothetical protein Edafosvirus19_26 [Edafosvirus sp.]|uniref:Zeta toxin domain-containing protein n=1 Tax=Edafosvirus sp. TaxID=2487765 RepID=A0A3G4ZYW6_9VIRU|nr:MAG: hypothetical protein Edafosvirus19_26 [Edafosvirus sp.]